MGKSYLKMFQKIYHKSYEKYIFFRFWVCMKDIGVFEKIHTLIIGKKRRDNQEWLEENSAFFKSLGGARIEEMLSYLSDEKSREVWKRVVLFKTEGIALDRKYYSLKNQYFPEDIIKIDEGEVFVDCGAYIGDTIQSFMNIARKQHVKWKEIIAFEPSSKHFSIMEKFYRKRKNISLINKGVSKKLSEAQFKVCENGDSKIDNDSITKIDTISLDLEEKCRHASFIKMDIEGTEMDALQGASELIRRNKPKLAICIYHSNEDMIRIIEYVHSLVPQYKLYVRNHSGEMIDTVMYAIYGKNIGKER